MKNIGFRLSLIILLFSLGEIMMFEGCKPEDISFNPKFKLSLGADTVVFDTVFTRIGSGTPKSVNKQFVVVNRNDKDVVTDIRLNSPDGFFRLNVDGTPGRIFDQVKIRAGDSIFVFVELYIDPNGDPESRPLIVRDSITFTTNGNVQQTQLVAWGQDAHYLFNDTLSCNTVWDDVFKPYVIYGYIYVPPGCEFVIKQGVKVHLAPYSWMLIEGNLKIEGTLDQPVFIEGDRLQPAFEETPGQWGGIWLGWPSANNLITHARIKNGTVGIYCDTISGNALPNVRLKNTMIRNMLFDGIAGRMSNIQAENCLINNCGRYTFLGQWGGNYSLTHCTFATYGKDFSRKDPTVVLTNRQRDELGRILNTFDLRSSFQNCIIYGNQSSELGFDVDFNRVDGFSLNGNLLKTEDLSLGQAPFNNVLNKNPKFIDSENSNYDLDSLSAAIDIGIDLIPALNKDILERNRKNKPDAGAFEGQK